MILPTTQHEVAYQLALTGRNLLVLGQAGAGKSTLIRALMDTFNYDKEKITVVSAPTHKAALLLNGCTLASLYRRTKYRSKNPALVRKYRDMIFYDEFPKPKMPKFTGNKDITTIIIDEFGMVRADELNELDRALKNAKKSDKPFGGVQIIAVGDYKQIPPVLIEKQASEYLEHYTSIYNFCSTSFKQGNFVPIGLTQNLRMGKFPDQVRLMEMIRKQENLEWVAQEINKYVTIDPTVFNHNLYVTKYNKVVDNINQKRLDLIEGQEYSLMRKDYIFSDRKMCLTNLNYSHGIRMEDIKIFPSEAEVMEKPSSKGDKFGFSLESGKMYQKFVVKSESFDKLIGQKDAMPRILKVKVGCKVMTYTNGFAQNGKLKYHNGQVFTLVGSRRGYLLLQDKNGTEYEIDRVRMPKVIVNSASSRLDLETVGFEEQFPIVLAYAQTYHKTQGQTLDEYTLDTRGDDFIDGLTYTGLSRATDLTKITVTAPVKASNLKIAPEVMDFYAQVGTF